MSSLLPEQFLKTDTKHVLFVASLIAFLAVTFISGLVGFHRTTAKVEALLMAKDSVIESAILKSTNTFPQIEKLKEQYIITRESKKAHLLMAKKYNSFQFTCHLLVIVCGVFSAMLLFLITKKGWDNIGNFYLKSSFLVFFLFGSLFGIIPEVFKNSENTKENYARYNSYSDIQIDIYDFIRNDQNNAAGDCKNSEVLNAQISEINKRIKENQYLFFGTDIQKIEQKFTSPISTENGPN